MQRAVPSVAPVPGNGWPLEPSSTAGRAERKKRPARANRPSLLWIDDYKPGLELYRSVFESMGYRVFTASSGEEGLRLAILHHVDVVVTDYEMPGMNGDAVTEKIKAANPDIPVILFSGSTLVPTRVRRRADAVCDKAGSRNQLFSTIHRLVRRKRAPALQPRL